MTRKAKSLSVMIPNWWRFLAMSIGEIDIIQSSNQKDDGQPTNKMLVLVNDKHGVRSTRSS